MPEPHWSVAEHRGPEGFASLEADWRRLYSDMPRPAICHSFEATSSFLEHLCSAPDRAQFLTLSDGERVRAILPLEEHLERSFATARRGLTFRAWGVPRRDGWSFSDAIGPEDDARRALLPAVVAHLRQDRDRPAILTVGRAWDASNLWDGLAELPPRTRFAFADGCEYVLPTDMSVEAFMARMRSKSRNTLRKAQRAFESLDGAEYVRAVGGADLAREYGSFLEVEGSGWKGRHGSAIRQQPRLEAFYRDLLERLRLDGHCEIHSLHAEGHCIAAALCMNTGDQCAVFKSGYDESYAQVSPGRLNNHKTLERACEDPAVNVVSEMSDAPWLLRWIPESRGISRAYVALRPVSGTLLLSALRLRYGPVRSVTRSVKAWRRARDERTTARRGRDAVALDARPGTRRDSPR